MKNRLLALTRDAIVTLVALIPNTGITSGLSGARGS